MDSVTGAPAAAKKREEEPRAAADEQTKRDLAPPQPPDEIALECSVCHNLDTVEGVLGRKHYPGSCGHCGGAFRVVRK